MERINFRCPDKLLKEAKRRADREGVSVGQLCRSLLEQATGVEVGTLPHGLAAANAKTRRRVAEARRMAAARRKKEDGLP